MKTPIISITFTALALAGLSFSLSAAENYTVLRICEDQHILRTSDGAEAGHIEYIVVEPAQQRIVSTVITGGVVGERHVSVPFTEFQMTAEREVVLHGITRERIVSAPVIEVERFRTSAVVEPAFFEKSITHFRRDAAVIEEKGRTTIESREGREVAPGSPRTVPGEVERPRRELRDLPPAGNIREERSETQTNVERETPKGRLSAPGAPALEEKAERRARPSDVNEKPDPAVTKERKGKGPDASDSRAVSPETKPQGESPTGENAKEGRGTGKKGNAERAGEIGEREKPAQRAAERAEKAEKTEKAEKPEANGTGPKHGKKEEAEKEAKSERSEKGERKQPKSDENK